VNERGCDYCADDEAMYFGHVRQIGSSDSRRKLLLGCPRYGWLYKASPIGPKDATHLTAEQAIERLTASGCVSSSNPAVSTEPRGRLVGSGGCRPGAPATAR
jgi:hypothetical protein